MMEMGEGPCFYQNIKKHEDDSLKEYATFPITVFEDDEEFLCHFPKEEAPEVDEIQL